CGGGQGWGVAQRAEVIVSVAVACFARPRDPPPCSSPRGGGNAAGQSLRKPREQKALSRGAEHAKPMAIRVGGEESEAEVLRNRFLQDGGALAHALGAERFDLAVGRDR